MLIKVLLCYHTFAELKLDHYDVIIFGHLEFLDGVNEALSNHQLSLVTPPGYVDELVVVWKCGELLVLVQRALTPLPTSEAGLVAASTCRGEEGGQIRVLALFQSSGN